MSTISRVQHVLGMTAPARVNHHPVQMITPRLSAEPANEQPGQSPQPEVVTEASAPTAAWDPHEVWLNRVKKPREQRSV